MSKNLTRKGLAFGALVALASSAFAGTPAFAADELTLAPNTGTLYKTIEGNAFKLLAGVAPATSSANLAQLKYQVVTTATLSAVVDTTSGADTTTTVTAGQPTNAKVYKGSNTAVVGYAQTLSLTAATVASGTPVTAAVTAFFDANANDVLDAGEFTSPARTVTWVDLADVTATVDLTQPTEAATTAAASVVFADLNQAQLTNTDIGIQFTKADGTALAGMAAAPADTVIAGALTDGKFSATSAAFTALTSTGTVKATVKYALAAADAAALRAGTSVTSVYKSATARTIATLVGSATAGSNAKNTGALTADNRLNSAFSVEAIAKNADSAAVSGVAVTATVTTSVAASLSSTKTLTVGSTTYNTANPTIADVALTTGADGRVSLALNTVGYAANDTITVTFKAQNFTSALVVTQKAAAYTVVEDADASVSGERQVTTAANFSATYSVVDQFKVAVGNGFRIKVTAANTTGTPVTAGDTYAVVSGGKATYTVATTAAGVFTVATDLEAQNATTGNWATSGASVPATKNVNVIASQNNTLTVTAAGNAALSAKTALNAEVAVDTRVSSVTPGTYTDGSSSSRDEIATVAGTIAQSVTGTLNKGAAVTVSGSGLLFKAGSVYKSDSITVFADGSGAYSVDVLSNVAGSFTVSVSAGSATAVTTTVVFAAADQNAGSSLVISGINVAKAGRTLVLTGTLKDKFGNPVAVAVANPVVAGDSDVLVTYDGPGFVVGTLPTSTDANGKFVVRVLLGSDEAGLATLTAKYDLNGDADYADATDLTATKTVLVGVSASVSAGSKKANVVVKNAEGLTVKVVSGSKSTTKVATSDSYKVSLSKLTSGSKTVKVYVNDILVASKKVTVRR